MHLVCVLWYDNSGILERCGMTERDGVWKLLCDKEALVYAIGEVLYGIWKDPWDYSQGVRDPGVLWHGVDRVGI